MQKQIGLLQSFRTMEHSKDQVRKLALSARLALGAAVRMHKSEVIAALLRNWEPYRRARAVCLYASFGSEVQTQFLLRQSCAPPDLAEGKTAAAGGAGELSQTCGGELQQTCAGELSQTCGGELQQTCAGELQQTCGVPEPAGGERFFCLPRVEAGDLVIHSLDPTMAAKMAAMTDAATIRTQGATQGPDKNDRSAHTERLPRASCMPESPMIWEGLVRSAMGMPEPPASLPLVAPQTLDVIVVPGCAFSVPSGHRLGYGKGFYDRLLAQAPQALKIGLCFDAQLFEGNAFTVEPHDIALDALVSESGIRDLRQRSD